MRDIVLLRPVFKSSISGEIVNENIPLAEVEWLRRFGEYVEERMGKLSCVNYRYARTWPFGRLLIEPYENCLIHSSLVSFRYINIKLIRSLFFIMAVLKISNKRQKSFIFYNQSLENIILSYIFRFLYIDHSFIMADFKRIIVRPTSFIFLSQSASERYARFKNEVIYLPVKSVVRDKIYSEQVGTKKLVMVYVGGNTRLTGLENFLLVNRDIFSENFKLLVVGDIDQGVVSKFTKIGIEFLGKVGKERLDDVCLSADFFVNPRDVRLDELLNTYPSKMDLYLSYDRPIFTTNCKSLNPNYLERYILFDSGEPLLLDHIRTVDV